MNRYFKTLPDGTTVWYGGFIHRDGKYIYTWNEELILADGWVKYIPPTPEPVPQTEPSTESIARQLLSLNSVKAEIVALSDEDALKLISLFPAWIDRVSAEKPEDRLVHAGERLYYNERLWKARKDHNAQADWTPDITPTLYVEVTLEDGSFEHPILYNNNMELVQGLYYAQDGVKYECTRSTGQPVYNPLVELVGLYVKVVNE